MTEYHYQRIGYEELDIAAVFKWLQWMSKYFKLLWYIYLKLFHRTCCTWMKHYYKTQSLFLSNSRKWDLSWEWTSFENDACAITNFSNPPSHRSTEKQAHFSKLEKSKVFMTRHFSEYFIGLVKTQTKYDDVFKNLFIECIQRDAFKALSVRLWENCQATIVLFFGPL